MNPLNLKSCRLTALPLELHLRIFSNLQPYDILQACQTCRALYLTLSERTLWMNALHRICIENTLFEPSFPIASMSVLELQHASMGPHRWITRSSSEERTSDGVLPHLAMRRLILPTMDNLFVGNLESLETVYLVPGGRYLFSFSCDWMALWDLGPPYISGKEPHIIATESVMFDGLYLVHSTPDGLGLRIFIPSPITDNTTSFIIYEIYPESTSPQITQIAHTCVPNSYPDMNLYSLSYDYLIFLSDMNALTVWDYKANMWARWGVENDGYCQILIAGSALALVRIYGASVWKIPPLIPESSLSTSTNPSVMSPVFNLEPPEGRFYKHFLQAPCGWYSGTPQPLYYDMIDSAVDHPRLNRFEVTINSRISDATLNLLGKYDVPSDEPAEVIRICQDKNVAICIDDSTGCIESHVTDIYDEQLPSFSVTSVTPLFYRPVRNPGFSNVSFCPVVGRIVCCEPDEWLDGIVILDF